MVHLYPRIDFARPFKLAVSAIEDASAWVARRLGGKSDTSFKSKEVVIRNRADIASKGERRTTF